MWPKHSILYESFIHEANEASSALKMCCCCCCSCFYICTKQGVSYVPLFFLFPFVGVCCVILDSKFRMTNALSKIVFLCVFFSFLRSFRLSLSLHNFVFIQLAYRFNFHRIITFARIMLVSLSHTRTHPPPHTYVLAMLNIKWRFQFYGYSNGLRRQPELL